MRWESFILKDIVKGGIKERFAQLRKMGIKTVMITGDNPLTAAAIAAEAGVDDFLAQATPETKLKLIREYQTGGRLVAMTGDGTNDAPALAQADVAVAMNTGTQPAREAANMVDLDSNPTKLLEIVEIGKQLLMTRGALTTFSIANDVAKYFAIIPAAFASTYPVLIKLNFMHLATPESAILSAVIFNALIIIALIPLALRGVPYRAVGAAQLLRDNLLIYGVGGLDRSVHRHQVDRYVVSVIRAYLGEKNETQTQITDVGWYIFNRDFKRNGSIAKHISCSFPNPSMAFYHQHLLALFHLCRNVHPMKNQLRPALTISAFHHYYRADLSAVSYWNFTSDIPKSIQRQPHHCGWKSGWLGIDRSAI